MEYSSWHLVIRLLMCALVLGAILDCVTTKLALSTGSAREGNPVIRWVMAWAGSKWVVVRLAIALLAIGFVLKNGDGTWPGAVSLVLQNSWTWFAVISNWLLYRRIRDIGA